MTSSKEYPNCKVDWPSRIGDGRCDLGDYNTEACNWDGGDCIEFNKYPNCKAYFPSYIGDGYCHGYYNTKECGWDGGDCFIAEYPDCHVYFPFWIGNGYCDGEEYNTKACGYDGGDCGSNSAVKLISITVGIIVFLSIIAALRMCFMKNNSTDIETQSSPSPPTPNKSKVPADRQTLVLTSIIHKKAIVVENDEADDDQKVKFTNENNACTISKNTTPSTFSHLDEIVDEEKADEEALQQDVPRQNNRKSDVIIHISKIEVFQDDSDEPYTEGISLNPKVCPICSEEYKNGDDITWSKNEQCWHAYHTHCIVPWLMDHDECPMCRNDYIFLDNKDDSSC